MAIYSIENEEMVRIALLQPYFGETTGEIDRLTAVDRITLCERHIEALSALTDEQLREIEATERTRIFAIGLIRQDLARWQAHIGNLDASIAQLQLALREIQGLKDVGFNRSSIHAMFAHIESNIARKTGDESRYKSALENHYISLELMCGDSENAVLPILMSIARMLSEREDTYDQALATYEILRGLQPMKIDYTLDRAKLLKRATAITLLRKEADFNNPVDFHRTSAAIAACLVLGERVRARELAEASLRIANEFTRNDWIATFTAYIIKSKKRTI